MQKAALSFLLASALTGVAQAQQPAPPPAPRPDTQRPPATAPATAAPAADTEPQLPNIDDPMLAPPPPARQQLRSWREALDRLRKNSTTLRTSLARVDEAAARSRQSLAAALPTLDAGAQVRQDLLLTRDTLPTGERRLRPDPSTGYGAGLSLSIPLFAPQAWYDRKTFQQAVDVAKLDSKEIERRVVAAVADTIVTTVTAERLAEVSRVSLRSALSTLDLNRRRSALGASSMLDVLRVEQEVQLARAQVVAADENLLRAREALGLALGSSEGWGVTTDIRLDSLASDARTSCQKAADVARRPDVLAAQANVEVTERAKGSLDWSFWPTLRAVSDLNYYGAEQYNGLRFTWTIGAILDWRLYDGGLRYGRKDEAEASARVARESLTDIRRRAELEVTQAFRAVKVAEANLAVSGRAREIAFETSRLSRVAFMNGSGTSFDLVDQARRLREAEIDLAVKEFDVLRARIAALLALSNCSV